MAEIEKPLKIICFDLPYAQMWKGEGMAVSSGNAQLHKITSGAMFFEEGPAGKMTLWTWASSSKNK